MKKRDGFTLVEVMVALALLSVTLAAVYSVFFLSHKALEGADDINVKLHECRMVIDTVRREVESSIYNEKSKMHRFKVEDRDIYGKQASRIFLTSFSPLMPGLSDISYFVEEKKGRLSLIKKTGSASAPDNTDISAEVIEGIESFTVEAMENNKWVKTWDSDYTKKAPEEIKISMAVLLKGRRLLLQETVKPVIGGAL